VATGKRQHRPLIVTKPLDRASPALRQVLTTNEVLTEVGLLFYKADPAGHESQFFTIKLTNAVVTSIELEMPNSRHPDTMTLETCEQVAFVYQKIEWTWTETGTVVVDDLTGAIS
jgi:type VI secretion system secreted protein Hcp